MAATKQKANGKCLRAVEAPPARPHGDLPDLRDSHTLASEVAKSIADAANIDAASLARNGGKKARAIRRISGEMVSRYTADGP